MSYSIIIKIKIVFQLAKNKGCLQSCPKLILQAKVMQFIFRVNFRTLHIQTKSTRIHPYDFLIGDFQAENSKIQKFSECSPTHRSVGSRLEFNRFGIRWLFWGCLWRNEPMLMDLSLRFSWIWMTRPATVVVAVVAINKDPNLISLKDK